MFIKNIKKVGIIVMQCCLHGNKLLSDFDDILHNDDDDDEW